MAGLQSVLVALAAADAVNTVTKRATEALMRGEMRDINLSPAYIKSKTDMALAQPVEAQADFMAEVQAEVDRGTAPTPAAPAR